MTGEEFSVWATANGFYTDIELAAWLRLSPSQIYRYRHGICRIPGPVEVACESAAMLRFLDELALATVSESLGRVIRLLSSRREKRRSL